MAEAALTRIKGDDMSDADTGSETNTTTPDLLAAATKLIAVFDEIKSTTMAERVITGRSDADLRRQGELAMADLRAALNRLKGDVT
jgi:hypothetical protein